MDDLKLLDEKDLVNGFAPENCYMIVHNYDKELKFYIGASKEYIVEGTSIPANCTLIPPVEYKENMVPIFNESTNTWKYEENNFGKSIYNINTKECTTFKEFGSIPDGYTLLKPTSEFDSWVIDKWVTNEIKKLNAYKNSLNSEKATLMDDIKEQLEILKDQIDLEEYSSEEELKSLEEKIIELKKIRIELNKMVFDDIKLNEEVVWPVIPS